MGGSVPKRRTQLAERGGFELSRPFISAVSATPGVFPSGGGAIGVGLSIVLHLGEPEGGWFPKPGDPPPVDRTVEIEDHTKREREIENAETLAAAAIKDTL